PLDGGVAAHVVGVAVGVDEPNQRITAQRALEQGDGLLRVRDIARIDHGGAVRRAQKDAVGGEPAALDDVDAAGQLQGGGRLAGSFASTARFSSGLITDHAAISSSVRWHPSHNAVSGFILHTLMQGEATSSEITSPASRQARAPRVTRAR